MFNKTLIPLLVLVSIVAFAWNPKRANAQAVTKGLIAYWPLDEATIKGETVKDVWGDSDGTIEGDPQVVAGKVKEALECDGTDDFVFVDSASINIDYKQVTLECWAYIKELDDSWNRIVTLDTCTVDPGSDVGAKLYYDADDKIYGFHMGVGNKFPANADLVQSSIPLNRWLHMVGVYDGKSAKYYEDGKLMREYAMSGTLSGGDLRLGIGDRTDGANADAIIGIVDEVRIYNQALSEAEVKQNYASNGLAVTPKKQLALTWGAIKVSIAK